MEGLEYESLNGKETYRSVLASKGIDFLISAQGKVPLSTLDRKTTCLYFSASWCRPCRSFDPQLVHLYNTLKGTEREVEIVFVSFDRDESGFTEHFRSMPWLAAPFDVDLRTQLWNLYGVNHIPFLIPVSSSGDAIEEDAVPIIDDYGIEAFPLNSERREQLKAMDEAKLRGGLLDDLLALEGRDYVVDGDGIKIPIPSLTGKTIGLYFGGMWCPPCRAFTLQLIEAYDELKQVGHEGFEIIFISTDRDQEEFDKNMSTMPWLAIPFKDRTRHDLSRIFNIKGIPALVILGTDGKTLTTDGRAMISSYGARAFPFTQSRITELEALLLKEGDGLPRLVRDSKHEHVLKLDMVKAYICNSCQRRGGFWVFSCNDCDYDLHPTCIDGVGL